MSPVTNLAALTLVNLLLVLSTGAADAWAMSVLLALTCAAPWIRRLNTHPLYAHAWRIGVLAVFAVLVRDCARTGPAYMLEDGLLLAAVSQVHILMNLGPRQAPDLLFLNSFVITLVTSYFAPGLSFSLLLVAYAVSLVRALARSATPSPALAGPDAWRRELALTGGTLALTATMFFALPRAFDREGLAWGDLQLARAARQVGFSPEVDLSRRGGATAVSNRIVMLVKPAPGCDAPLPSYWRGATLRVFADDSWHESPLSQGISADVPWHRERGGRSWLRKASAVGGSFVVEQRDLEAERLLLPQGSVAVRLDEDLPLHGGTDATLRLAEPRRGRGVLRLTVQLAAPGAEPVVEPSAATREHLLALPRMLPPALRTLAQTARNRAGRGADARQLAQALATLLAEQHRYAAPGDPDNAETLEDFLVTGGAGHCELFATTAALVLRTLGVPCRLATGYRATDTGSGPLVIRARNAHAWIEVLDREGGFWTFDPTPASAGSGETGSTWTTLWEKAQDAWGALVRFDDQGRMRGLAWLVQLPVRRPVTTGLAVAAVLLLWWHQASRRRRRVPAAVRAYLRHAAGTRQPAETPRELLARSADPQLGPATAAHEAARYATGPSRP